VKAKAMLKLLRILGHSLFVLALSLATAWAATALWVQIAAPLCWLFWAALGASALAALILHWRRPAASWGLIAASALLIGGWYASLQPSQSRNWAADVAHGVSGEVSGSSVALHNIRNFGWTSETEASPRWEDRQINLDQLETVDMVTSSWDSPEIAHLIVSFGFADGQHVAFSVEIRREEGEEFSSIGGFFRQFELVLIAATEEDVIALRAQQRHEDVHLYPVKLNAEQRRALFLTYLDFGNQLAAKPEFYNTVTANCASTVYHLVKAIKPDMPLDSSLLLSGRLPEYINRLGGLQGNMPMAERFARSAITAKAQAIPAGAEFSALLREN
jgi:hypothetical protein